VNHLIPKPDHHAEPKRAQHRRFRRELAKPLHEGVIVIIADDWSELIPV
jgi:hypothetical protein